MDYGANVLICDALWLEMSNEWHVETIRFV